MFKIIPPNPKNRMNRSNSIEMHQIFVKTSGKEMENIKKTQENYRDEKENTEFIN